MADMRKLVGFVLRFAVVGLAAAFIAVYLKPELLTGADAPGLASTASYSGAVGASSPSVVNVYAALTPPTGVGLMSDDLFRDLQNDGELFPLGASPNVLGSGVVVDPDGYIVTNFHLIDGSYNVSVAFADGRVASANLVGTDPETDLALLKVDDMNDLPAIHMGRSDTLQVGDVVLAIGNPYGLSQTVTQGIISATRRTQLGLSLFENFIQTDASINPGNSGGALVNARGELVGINTAKYSGNGIGFAIPVNLVRGVMTQLIEHGRVARGWLGVSSRELLPNLALELGLPKDATGILVQGVYEGSPADRAGLRIDDVIQRVDGEPVRNGREALIRIAGLPPGSQIRLSGWRAGKAFETLVELVERQPLRPRS